jgi:hypothetical protein
LATIDNLEVYVPLTLLIVVELNFTVTKLVPVLNIVQAELPLMVAVKGIGVFGDSTPLKIGIIL